jgi:hypothetical protein
MIVDILDRGLVEVQSNRADLLLIDSECSKMDILKGVGR